VKQGLAILTDNAAADVADTDVRDHTVVRVIDEVIVDLMGRACGLSFADVAADVEWRDMAGVRVPVASPAALFRTKDTYRPQDAIDRSFLQPLIERRRSR
jgi:hypothetical protein